MGVKSLIKQVLVEQQNKKYERLLASKTLTYDEWIKEVEQGIDMLPKEGIPSSNVSAHDDRCFFYFLRPGVKAFSHVLETLDQYFEKHPQVQIIYGDEDVLEENGKRSHPWFKPDWSPDLLDTYFYFGSLVAVRKELWQQVQDCSEYLDRIYECVCLAGGFKKGCTSIAHIPEILCHCESKEQIESWLQITYGNQYGVACKKDETKEKVKSQQKLSVIIPSKDNPDILNKCLQAIPEAAGELPYEIIIVDNGSSEENRQRIHSFVDANIQYLYEPMEFNFAKMCNLGAEAATGELYLFLNDDVELVEKGSLCKMAELARHDYTGAVGMKLYYPDSVRIQHAGITNLPMGPVHKLQFKEDCTSYYFDSNKGLRNFLAVTAACLMVSRDKFKEAGGFAEELKVAFNDVDFCFKLYELGYHNVCRNDCFAYHHESLSRGNDESTRKWLRLQRERTVLYERHPRLEAVDPYYGTGLARRGLDTAIRPAYLTSRNKLQMFAAQPWKGQEKDYRKDNCLLVRIEQCKNGYALGYGVVLGDNNACYEFELLLKKNDTGEVFSVLLDGKYRPDLLENMPDQVNVGLCGFEVQTGRFPEGEYELQMTARNRVTGLKLINDTGRSMTISYKGTGEMTGN